MCITFPLLMVLDFLRLQAFLPSEILLLPELLSGIALLLALRAFASNRKLMIGPGFVVWFVIMLLFLAFGLVAAEATTGPIVGGIRFYLKYLPFFIIPLVHQFSEREVKHQLLVILTVSMLQAPLALVQRFILHLGESGDEARGTFATGSMSATFLLMTLAVIVACYHKNLISRLQTLGCGAAILITISIGDVKGAFLLLPLALIIPTLMVPNGKPVGRKLINAGIPAILALTLFAMIYNVVESKVRFQKNGGEPEYRTSIIAFLTNPTLIVHYLAPRQLAKDGEHKRSGRIDDILEPIAVLTDHPIRWITGLGMGAVTENPIDAFSTDQHAHLVDEGVVSSSISVLLWELGLLGTALIALGAVMVWRTAKIAMHDDKLAGAIALGWLAAVPIFFVALFWKNMLGNDPISAAFAYFSGHVLACAYQLKYTPTPLPQANNSLLNSARDVADHSQASKSAYPPILQTANSRH